MPASPAMLGPEPLQVVRARKAWALACQGKNHHAIADELGVSTRTVQRDLEAALVLVHEETISDAKAYVLQQLAQYDALIEKWTPFAHKSTAEGAHLAAAVLIRCLENKAKLLGLENVKLSGGSGGSKIAEALASAETRALLRQMLDSADAQAASGVQASPLPAVQVDGL